MSAPPKAAVILLAGGSGTRMQSAVPKQYLPLKDRPVALHSFEVFAAHPQIVEIVIVCDPGYRCVFPAGLPNLVFALPGPRRQDSMENGFHALRSTADIICVHDAARPLIDSALISRVIQEASQHGAATVGMPVKFTIKQGNSQGFVDRTLDRSLIWEIQTPQALKKELLHKGLEKVRKEAIEVTDDVALAELLGVPVKLVHGSYTNLKITTPDDMAFAEFALGR